VVGHATLAPTGTPTSALTARNRAGGDVVITFAVFQVFIFGTTWGPTPWVYLGESFPLRVRPKSIALGSASSMTVPHLLFEFNAHVRPRLVLELYAFVLLSKDCRSVSFNYSQRYWDGSDRFTRIGPMIMLVFFGMLVFGYIYVYFAIPETKGLTLEEVIIHAHCKLLPI
jgi:SP family sugar:H+ symporter-like MFS transporter